MCSDDLADACIFLMQNYCAAEIGELVNLGVGKAITINELAVMIAEIVGFNGKLAYDPGKPDGTPCKLVDVTKINDLGWQAKISLRDGINLAFQDYQQRFS